MIRTSYKTRQQDLLLHYVMQTQGKHFTAEDVRIHFAEKEIAIGTATIYRQLEKLVKEGKLQKYIIDEHSAACFEYTGECSTDEQHFHLKCEKCGRLIHLECDELEQIKKHLLEEHGFVLDSFRTVFYGKCADCASR